MKRTYATLLLAVGVMSVVGHTGGQSNTPERKWEVFLRFPPPPPTIQGLVDEAAAVVVVSVDTHRTAITDTTNPKFPTVETVYEGSIVDILKDNVSLPRQGLRLAFSVTGGQIDTAEGRLRAHSKDYARLQDGRSYVLFLQPLGGDHPLAAWTLRRGAESLYEVTGNAIVTDAESAVGGSQNGRSVTEFITQVRAAARR